jgi:hypothetical protein
LRKTVNSVSQSIHPSKIGDFYSTHDASLASWRGLNSTFDDGKIPNEGGLKTHFSMVLSRRSSQLRRAWLMSLGSAGSEPVLAAQS